MRRRIAACACSISDRASPRPIARCCSVCTALKSSRSSRRKAIWSRFLGTTYGSHTTLSAVYNRGNAASASMKHKDGIAIAQRLAKECDVLIEGFRPASPRGSGLATRVSRDNPGLIYLSVSAFGQSGPYSKRPGSDSVAQAFPAWCRSMSATTEPAPGRHHDLRRRYRRLCLPGHRDDAVRARPSAPDAGSMSTSASRLRPARP